MAAPVEAVEPGVDRGLKEDGVAWKEPTAKDGDRVLTVCEDTC